MPFGAGSVTDILARIFAEEMGKRWGQQVIVENRPGLAGTTAVGKSAPDGYTLMVTSNGHTVAGLVSKTLPVDPVKDFAGITRLGSAPLFLITNPELPAKTLKDVIELAKKEPGKLNFSSPGLASTTFIAGALFRKAAGINIVHVPFKSAPDAVTAVMRGDAQMYFAPVNLARDQSEAGKVNAIAAATAKRIPDMPDVPTFTEAGLPFVYDSWFGLMAPHGVPKPILDKISKDWADALKTPEMQAKLKSAVPDRRDRYAGGDGQDHQRRDRKPDQGVQGGRHLSLVDSASLGRAWTKCRARLCCFSRGSAWPITRLIDGERRRNARSTSSTFSCTACTVERRIDAAVEVDDLAFVGLAHAHIVDVADHAAFGRDLGKRDLDRARPAPAAPRGRRPPAAAAARYGSRPRRRRRAPRAARPQAGRRSRGRRQARACGRPRDRARPKAGRRCRAR